MPVKRMDSPAGVLSLQKSSHDCIGKLASSGNAEKEQYKLARIRIDIDNGQDKEWGIDVKKSIAVPPVSKQDELRRIAIATQRLSAQVFRHRGKKITRTSRNDKTYFWHQRIRDGKIGYEINRNHPFVKRLINSEMKQEVQQLLRMLEETIPVPAIISDYSENTDQMLTPLKVLLLQICIVPWRLCTKP